MDKVKIATFQIQWPRKIAMVVHEYPVRDLCGIFAIGSGDALRFGNSVIEAKNVAPRLRYSPMSADDLMAGLLNDFGSAAHHIKFSGMQSASTDEMIAEASGKNFDALDLPPRFANLFYSIGTKTVGEIARLDDHTLLSIPDMGLGGLAHVRRALSLVRKETPEQNIQFENKIMGYRSILHERMNVLDLTN